MKLINRVAFAIIYINITNRKIDSKDSTNENVKNCRWLPSGWLPSGWLPSGRLPIWLFACGSACAMCLDMLAIMYVAEWTQLINNN